MKTHSAPAQKSTSPSRPILPPTRAFSAAIESKGRPLASDVRGKMEKSFGVDFSQVRVHEGAHTLALGATAFARGEHVHFAPGLYAPASAQGQALLGHELAHVVQQRAGRVGATSHQAGTAINSEPALERSAKAAGKRASQAQPVAELAAPVVVSGSAAPSSSAAVAQRQGLDDLPDEVLLNILNRIPRHEQANVGNVDRRFRNLVQDPSLAAANAGAGAVTLPEIHAAGRIARATGAPPVDQNAIGLEQVFPGFTHQHEYNEYLHGRRRRPPLG